MPSDAESTIKLDVREIARSVSKRPALVVLQGPNLGQTILLENERTVIGRGSHADIVINDEIASRMHAEVLKLQAAGECVEYYLHDRRSTNGTFLNGSRVTNEQLLQDGDKIKIGKHLFKFAILDDLDAEFQERLHQMTQRDELTGLKSRRSLFADLDREVGRAVASGTPQCISVLMMDLDFFKQVNDGRGHLVGSQTIRAVAHIIRDIVGTPDLAARFGGEEYFAYVPVERERGLEIAEKIRRAVESHEFPASTTDPDSTMRITISIGVAAFSGDGNTALDLILKADQALYRAKLGGRNRTCAYDPSIDRPDRFYSGVDPSAIIDGPADAQ